MSGPWVVDAAVAVKWVLPEPDSALALRLRGDRLLAPELLDIEGASVLWKAARRGEITEAEAEAGLALLSDAPVERLPVAPLLPGALRHALRQGHPIHDCLYIEAALASGFPLVTADRRLARLDVPGCRIRPLDSFS